MALLVTGTIGIDTVETPQGKAVDVLGGSAVYFAFSASLITRVRLVGAVGDDFPAEFLARLGTRDIDLTGLERRSGSKTFRWAGRYVGDMNAAVTLRTDLNVVAEAPPKIPEAFRATPYVFLANTHPAVQREFIAQLRDPRLVVCDTMNLWIGQHRADLLKTLAMVDAVVLNDGEARMLTGHDDLIAGGRKILRMGPRHVVIKKGAHGAMMVTGDDAVVLPAYPTDRVVDPTGAGDSFAGAMMGYLASVGRADLSAWTAAMARGTCAASITIEGFSTDAIAAADRQTLESRLAKFRTMLQFE